MDRNEAQGFLGLALERFLEKYQTLSQEQRSGARLFADFLVDPLVEETIDQMKQNG